MSLKTFLLTVLLALAILCGCTPPSPPAATAEAPSPQRRQQIRNAFRASVWTFVYCLEEGQQETELVSFLQELAASQPRGKRVEVINCADLPADFLTTNSFSVFGTRLPPGAEGFDDDGRRIVPHHPRADGEVMLLPYLDNPWNDGQAVAGFYLADDPGQLLKVLRSELSDDFSRIFWSNWAYEFHAENGDRIYGAFHDAGWDFNEEAEIEMQSPDVPVFSETGLNVYAYDGAVSDAYVQRIVTALRTVSEVTEVDEFPEVRIYPNLERLGMRSGNMRPAQYDPERRVLHLVPSFLDEDELLLDLTVWHPFVARTQVRSKDTEARIAALQQANAERIGTDRLNRRMEEAYRIAATGVLAVEEGDYPSQFLREAAARIAAAGPGRPRLAPPRSFGRPARRLAGMTFAHQGYRVHNGYGGTKIMPALDSLAQLNVNALAVVPYTFMRQPDAPTPFFIPAEAGQENDWATIHSLREGADRGWFVMLKPQIWLGGGHWPGDVDFATEEDWDRFFEYYRYWILHYAVLAQREGVDALCLGTELVRTTLKHPDRWREIIAQVRSVYGGQLTYAANWGEEFENFTFWEDLDAIGLNSYYPLAAGETASDEELLAGAHRWLKMATEYARRNDRPLWLTEVGYRSVTAAWQHPHAEAGDRAVSFEDQARCYRALLTAAADYRELRGAFFWKWPTYLGHGAGREDNRYFTPGGKPAAAVLADFYQRWLAVR